MSTTDTAMESGGGNFDMEEKVVTTANLNETIERFATRMLSAGQGGVVMVRTWLRNEPPDPEVGGVVVKLRLYLIRRDGTWKRFQAREARFINNWDYDNKRALEQEEAVIYEGFDGKPNINWVEAVEMGRGNPYEEVPDYPQDIEQSYGWRHAQHW